MQPQFVETMPNILEQGVFIFRSNIPLQFTFALADAEIKP